MLGVELYLLFMVSVGIWSAYELMRPAIMIMSQKDPNDVLVQNKKISYLVMFCMGAILGPVMFVVILVPSLHNQVILAMTLNRD